MKKTFLRLIIVALILTAVTGCDETAQTPTAPQSQRADVGKVGSTINEATYEHALDFADGQIFLFNPTENREGRELFVPLRSTVQNVSMGEFVLRLFNPASDSTQAIGGELYSRSGELLFGLQIEIDSVNITWARITEYTDQDRLSMLRTISSDSVVETYSVPVVKPEVTPTQPDKPVKSSTPFQPKPWLDSVQLDNGGDVAI